MSRRDAAFTAVGCVVTTLFFVAVQVVRVSAPLVRKRAAAAASASASAGGGPGAASPAMASASASGSPEDAMWRAANANLVETVRLTQQRLDRNEAEKKELQSALRQAQAKLAATAGDGGVPRSEFDLSQDDWKQLAKDGNVKARYPCAFSDDWHVGADKLTALGLAPDDAPAVEAAYKREEARLWSALEPGCAKILSSDELARRLGPSVCMSIVTSSLKDMHPDLQLVADVRAGNRAAPGADQLDPLASLLLAETAAMPALQADLAQTFGPEEAHRLAFSEELGSCSSSWGGPPPKR